jgi:FkbH-like protein
MTMLSWLPVASNWRPTLRTLSENPDGALASAVLLARHNLDFVKTNQLDDLILKLIENSNGFLDLQPLRLALLGSSTTTHLHSAIRVAGVRKNLRVEIYEGEFGQYWQELSDQTSGLHEFRPNVVVLSLDAYHLSAGINSASLPENVEVEARQIADRVRACWRLALDAFKCSVIHQAPLPVYSCLMGHNEHRLAGSKATFTDYLTNILRKSADENGVDFLSLDKLSRQDGLASWHDRGLWHRAKQEIGPSAAPFYGEQLMRLIAAKLGRSSKCLVLDLDNTLWGGVVGDDGLEGLVLGQGSALGEAFTAFQEYARELSRRGIILAVCSKNDETNALEPFEKHPEMVLRRSDIACFKANWSDKAENLRAIAAALNIGIDSLVFIDDNPFERELIRKELPAVSVPECGDDPTYFAEIIDRAGYFEAIAITQEDRQRAGQYQEMQLREALRASATDLPSYLRSLDMRLVWRRFDRVGLARIVQLINKTNQFNLTTRRYSEEDVIAVMEDSRALGLQFRLLDRFGDNGIIAIVIGRFDGEATLSIETWLMSCRVLGRTVEQAILNLIARQARDIGAVRLIGDYIPTKKNGMVKSHYLNLGFTKDHEDVDGSATFRLELTSLPEVESFISIEGA